jgi:hypothetical protein
LPATKPYLPVTGRALCAILISTSLSFATVRAEDFSPAAADPTQAAAATSQHEPAKRITLKGVPDLQQVGPNLYRGNQPSTEGYANLAKMGIQIVIDMRLSTIGYDRKRVTAAGMQFISIPWFCMLPSDKVFAQFLQIIRDNPNKKIYIHCRLGDDRAGMAIAAYRMAEQGWTAEEARKEMIESGADWLHRRLCPTLAGYERKFPEHFQTKPAFAKLRSTMPPSEEVQSAPPPENASQK